ASTMEMDGIFIEQIKGGKILPPTEPLIYQPALFVVHLKIPPVGVDGVHHRIPGMNDQAEAASKKMGFPNPKILLHALGQGTMDSGNIDPALFKYLSVFDNPGPAPATFRTFPLIFPEPGFPVNLFQF